MKKRGTTLVVVIILVLALIVFLLFRNTAKDSDIKIANPASAYCIQQGHNLEIRDEENGQVGYCVSSDGQECEEWSFYYGECSFEGYELCVKNSCCHATGCVLESEAPDCSDAICTMICSPDTLDCGAGYCAFVDGNCEVVWNEN